MICLLKSTSMKWETHFPKEGMQMSVSVCGDCISLPFPLLPQRELLRRRNLKFAKYLLCVGPFVNIFLLYPPTPLLGCKFYLLHFIEEEPGLWVVDSYTQHSDGSWIQTHLCRTSTEALKGSFSALEALPGPSQCSPCLVHCHHSAPDGPKVLQWARNHSPTSEVVTFISPTSPWEEAIELIELRAP